MRRRRAAAAAALLLAGCGGDEQARVVLLEPGWRVELLGAPGQGFVSPDGLLWHDGSLLMADESGGAVRRWTPGGPSAALAGAEAGLSSPEDLARDAGGRLYVTDDNAGGVRRIDPDGRVALGLALVMHRRMRGVGAERASVFVPTVIPDVAYALLWLWILNPQVGILNSILGAIGIDGPNWMSNPQAKRPSALSPWP